jgi:hypothetical protein
MIITGLAIYVLFIPALMVPASLNDQDFEHRAYLPFFGILLTLAKLFCSKFFEAIIFNCWRNCFVRCSVSGEFESPEKF